MEFYVIFSVVVIGIAYAIRRVTDPARLERKRVERLRALGTEQHKDDS